MHLLQVSGTTGESSVATESDGTTKMKVYHWNTWQANPHEAIVYHVLGTTPNHCKSGISHTDDVQIQIATWHPDSMEAATIAAKVRTALEGWQGTYSGTIYHQTLLENEVESWDAELEFYGIVQTWTLSHVR